MRVATSLRARIFWSVIPTFVILLVIVGFVNVRQQGELAEKEFLKRGRTMASNLAHGAELGVLAENGELLAPAVRGVVAEDDVVYVLVYGLDAAEPLTAAGRQAKAVAGQPLRLSAAERTNLGPGESSESAVHRRVALGQEQVHEFVAAIVGEPEVTPDEVLLGGESGLARASGRGGAETIGHVRLGLSASPIQRQQATTIKSWTLLALFVVALSTLAVFFVAKHVTEPVKRLTTGAERLAQGHLDEMIPARSGDEVGHLADAFNRMAASLKRNIERKEQLLGEVQEFNQTLEEKILERTAELEERTKALQAANKHKSEFLANMSHELRTPLNAIIGYSEMLQEEAAGAGVDGLQADLSKIHASGKHLLALINDVLDLSKIEAGRMELFEETFDVKRLLQDAVATVAPLAKQNSNLIEVDAADDLGTMRGDPMRVRQCLLNVVSNACKFTHAGRVTVRATRVTFEGEPFMSFQVVDTGIGMTAEQLSRVFDAFQQADGSTTRKYGGTGLGLTICREFVRMMDGRIDVKSVPDKGTTFTIELPVTRQRNAGQAAQPAQEAPHAAAQPAARTGPSEGLVLVIEDDEQARELMQRYLSREGFDVRTCPSGEEGIRLARELRPTAITLDVLMPEMDGWSVLRALKGDPELAEIPVIMVTMIDNRRMGYALGATEYLVKPVGRENLVRVLKRYRCAHPPCPLLVVEDDEPTRALLRRLLEREDWAVHEAENGRIALDRMKETPPELIILDLMMPEMDGFEFLHELRKNKAWRAIPVIVLTAKTLSPEDRTRLNGGVTRILAKGSYEQAALLTEVRDLVAACVARDKNAPED